jgi:NitT/TauT family transport system substrate-binding protein
MFHRRVWVYLQIVTVLVLGVAGCSSPHFKLTPFDVKIDWVPSPEYYGFFYAKARGFYDEVGLAVTISHGTGASPLSEELGKGTVYAGTTTSDNLLRAIANGGSFESVVPLLRFNPCVLVVRQGVRKGGLKAAVVGKRIGTNKASGVYPQFLQLLANAKIPESSLKQVPVGYGGADVFKLGDVDAFLAYTTNVVVDLEIQKIEYEEFDFGEMNLESFGLVLAWNSKARDAKPSPSQLTGKHFDAFAKATLRGYSEGGKDVTGAVTALRNVAPTLDTQKLHKAIEKIGLRNKGTRYDLAQVDRWVSGISDAALAEHHRLLRTGLEAEK